MGDPVKHLCPDGNLFSDLKTIFSLFNSRRTKIFAYGFIFTFVCSTAFLAFFPNSNNTNSSPWFSTIFKSHPTSSSPHFSSFFSHFFPNSSSHIAPSPSPFLQGQKNGSFTTGVLESKPKQTEKDEKVSGAAPTPSKPPEKKTEKKEEKALPQKKTDKGSNNSSTGVTVSNPRTMETDKWFESFRSCNIFDGKWVKDNSYPLYEPGSCPHIDEPFNCFLNGRPEKGYQSFRWQPNGCNIPRLEGKKMLELLRGKRLVFVGDSLNRNMWESLVCVLRDSVEDKSKVFEASGRREFRTEGSYSFVFKDYNCSVEFFRSPFLVQEFEMPESDGTKKETLRLDLVERSSSKYKNADVIIFNTGHWWTHEKTSKGKGYYQEGSHIYGELNVAEAFRKALTTWARWVDANVDHNKSLVFFRGYSASHFKGGRWNSGGQCDSETEPIRNETYLGKYPPKMRVLERVMKGMKTPVFYLNITRMTDYRKDAHPSVYRKQNLSEEERKSPLRFQDCSHWCLPGVPDTWNELVYAQLLMKHYKKNHQQQQQQKGQ